MRFRTVLLILVAIVLAGGTAMLARSWLAAQRTQVAAQAAPVALPPPVKSVLVARHPIGRGDILRATDFAWQPWPSSGINKSYIMMGSRTPESFRGWVARHPMTAGQPVTLAQVVAPGSRGFLAAVLRPGMRAVSVPVNATTGISGFVFPGDQVDILITYPLPNTVPAPAGTQPVQHKVSETILRNIRVLGIDQRLEQKAGEAVIAHTATLEVTPKQSEVIALASEMGQLSLSLRSLAKSSNPTVQPVADSSDGVVDPTYTLDSQVSPLLPKPLSEKARNHSDVVTILRGNGQKSESTGASAAPRGS